MRIDPKLVTAVAPNEPREAKPAPAGKAAGEASVVKLSTAGAAVTASPEEPSDVTARISNIRALVARGAYPIDLDKLASRIVDDELLRGGS